MKTLDTGVYTDFSGLARLRNEARSENPETLRKVARQFESIFLQMTLKSMREAGFGDDLMNSDKSLFYRDMYDKQLALHLAEKSRIGLADLIVKQLGGEVKNPMPVQGRDLADYRRHPEFPAHRQASGAATANLKMAAGRSRTGVPHAVDGRDSFPGSPAAFVEKLRPYAVEAADDLGVHPGILLAQAALESGWGKRMIRHTDGSNSHNLFGIKADKRWAGAQIRVPTLEYSDGIAQKRHAAFRSYSDYAESFRDYVNFLRTNPRYQEALARGENPAGFIGSLQKAGYATDPDYAAKVMRIFRQHDLASSGSVDAGKPRGSG